jgi:hypothetical protein
MANMFKSLLSGIADVGGDFGGWLNIFENIFAFLGRKPRSSGEKVPSSELKSEEGLPTGLLTEKFTLIDESYWQTLKKHLDAPVAKTVGKLIVEMKKRDKMDNGNRIDSFRIGVLIMPNKITEEIKTETTSAPADKKEEKSKSTAAEKTVKTTSKKIDPRFTDNDTRVLYLNHLTKLVKAEMDVDKKSEDEAIVIVVDNLEAEKFLVTGETFQKAKELSEKAADGTFEEVLRFRLGKEDYERIGRENPRISREKKDKYQERLRELRLRFLKEREARRQAEILTKSREKLTPCDRTIVGGLWIIFALVILSGFIYGILVKYGYIAR